LRPEDRQTDGVELARKEERKRAELEELERREEPELDADVIDDLAPAQQGVVLSAMRQILDRKPLVVSSLRLPRREARALERLQFAAEGRDHQDEFVFASDRRDLLEQSLAILQPTLANSLADELDNLVAQVGGLRVDLRQLETSQDPYWGRGRKWALLAKAKPAGDKDDPEGGDEDAETTDDAPAGSSLTGPERAIAKPASSLAGPAREPPTKPATSLGDPREIEEAAARHPWWRRSR
jgi:hypothetical protein